MVLAVPEAGVEVVAAPEVAAPEAAVEVVAAPEVVEAVLARVSGLSNSTTITDILRKTTWPQ